MKIKTNVLKDVNKIYSLKNPSTYVVNLNKKKIDQLVKNRKEFFIHKLKLPSQIYKDSKLLELGCGSGQNSIYFDHQGCTCTMIEFDKKSFQNTLKLFKKYSKNKFKLYNQDLFKFKTNQKFDFVVSNAVAHHTKDIRKNITLASKFLKKGGYLILGIGETNGYFQRHFQRYILYNLASNESEIYKLANSLFRENINRGKKYGGRTTDEIIYDTYLNPKIETLSFKEVIKIFNKNSLYLYSSDENSIKIDSIYGFEKKQFRILKNDSFSEDNSFQLNSILNFFYSKSPDLKLKLNSKRLDKLLNIQEVLANKLNDQSFYNLKKLNLKHLIKNYYQKINKLPKIDMIDKKNSLNFTLEILKIIKILEIQDKDLKIKKIKKIIKENSRLFKKYNGKGMNYFVGLKY